MDNQPQAAQPQAAQPIVYNPTVQPPVPPPPVPPPIDDHGGQSMIAHAKEVASPPEVATLIGGLLAFGIHPTVAKSRPAAPPVPTNLPATPMPKVFGPQQEAAMAPPPVKGLPLVSKSGSTASSSSTRPSALSQLDWFHTMLYRGIIGGYIVPKAKGPPKPKGT